MNIQDLKLQIASETGAKIPTLMLSQQENEAGEKQPWYSHWDDTTRTRISFPEEVAQKIAADPAFDGLAFKMATVPATPERKEYRRYTVIIPTSVVFKF